METLCKLQEDIFVNITKIRNSFSKTPLTRLTQAFIETHLDNLEEQWIFYNQTHRDIIVQINREDYEKSSYYHSECYDRMQELYFEFKVDLKEKMLCTQEKSSGVNNFVNNVCNVKLPKICIPQFSGKYTEWSSFRDLFVSLVHLNDLLDDVQKMYYLKGHLTGEAEQLLRNVAVTSENYEVCWDLLRKRFDNKKFLLNNILERLLNQNSVSVECSSQIRCLLDTTHECMNALRNEGVNVEQWDLIIIHIISRKLDFESRKLWESKVSSLGDKMPTLKEFEDFLTCRFRALEYLDTEPIIEEAQEQLLSCNVICKKPLVRCRCCSGDHRLSFCKVFAAKDFDSRREFVHIKGICFNCLGNNHSAKHCKNPSRCQDCKKRHHFLLHQKDPSKYYDNVNTNKARTKAPTADGTTKPVHRFSSWKKESVFPAKTRMYDSRFAAKHWRNNKQDILKKSLKTEALPARVYRNNVNLCKGLMHVKNSTWRYNDPIQVAKQKVNSSEMKSVNDKEVQTKNKERVNSYNSQYKIDSYVRDGDVIRCGPRIEDRSIPFRIVNINASDKLVKM